MSGRYHYFRGTIASSPGFPLLGTKKLEKEGSLVESSRVHAVVTRVTSKLTLFECLGLDQSTSIQHTRQKQHWLHYPLPLDRSHYSYCSLVSGLAKISPFVLRREKPGNEDTCTRRWVQHVPAYFQRVSDCHGWQTYGAMLPLSLLPSLSRI